MNSKTNESKTSVNKKEEAESLAKRYVMWTVGGGLIPIPILDLATILGIQIKMLGELSKIYEVSFSEHRAKGFLYPLFTAIGVAPFGAGLLGSLFKVVPFVGHALGSLSLSIVAGALTHATAKVFITHFESGGTLMDFNPENVKAYFEEQFKEGQKMVHDMREKFVKNTKKSEEPEEVESVQQKKAPAKKASARKASAKKAPVKKASAKKAPAKNAPAKKAPAKKAPAKKAPVRKAPARKAPEKNEPPEKKIKDKVPEEPENKPDTTD